MTKFISFLFSLTVLSCSSPMKHIHNKNFKFSEKTNFEDNIKDKLIEVIAKERKESPDRFSYSAIALFSKENIMDKAVNNFAITDSNGLSDIYEYPCSGYALFDGVLILIYDKHKGYINPTNYPKSFLEIARKHMFDDWTLYKVDCSDDRIIMSGLVSNHSSLIEIKGNKQKIKKYFQFSVGKLFYGEKHFYFTRYFDLDNFRIVCPKPELE